MSRWQIISALGESVFLMPCAVFLYGWLRRNKDTAAARHWLGSLSLAILLVLVSKLAFLGWGIGIACLNFTGFSGHAAMAAAVLPVALFLCMPERRPELAITGAALGGLMAVAVAVSRLKLHAHSTSEVAGGLALGYCVSLSFVLRGTTVRGSLTALLRLAALVVLSSVPAIFAQGLTHAWLEATAMHLSGHDRPYRRGEWGMSVLDMAAPPRGSAPAALPGMPASGEHGSR